MANLTKNSELKQGDIIHLLQITDSSNYTDVCYLKKTQHAGREWLPNIGNMGFHVTADYLGSPFEFYFTNDKVKVIGRFVIKSLKGGNHGL